MVHDSVSHSKCKKCNAVKNVTDLTEWSAGLGRVCIDEAACSANKEESQRASRSEAMKPALDLDQLPTNSDA